MTDPTARAYLAAPDEPASVAYELSDEELLELMPETMRDEFAACANTYSTATGGVVKPSIFRTVLNAVALEHARRVAQVVAANRSRTPAPPAPLSPSDRMPGTMPGDLDDAGRCWLWSAPADSLGVPSHWRLLRPEQSVHWDRWLPGSVKYLPAEVE